MKFQPIEILQTVSFTLFDWHPWLLNLCLLIKLHSYSIFAKILEAEVSISRWWCRGSLAGCVFRVWIYHSQESQKSSYLVAQWLCLIWFVVIEAMVLDPAGWPECKSLATSKVSPLNQLRTTLAFAPHVLIPRKNLKKTKWRRCGRSRSDAQVSDGITKNSENISTQGTVRSESQCTRKYFESVPQKYVKCSLYTWAFSLSWRLHLWTRGSHPAVHVSLSGAFSTWASLLLFKPFN